MRTVVPVMFLLLTLACSTAPDKPEYPIQPVPFTDVAVDDEFWAPRIETNRTVTIPANFRKCEETGRIDNFLKAAGKMEGPYVGRYYNDSDVFKVIEGAAYSLSLHPDPELDAYLDDLIGKIAGAQEDDGYLYAINRETKERVYKTQVTQIKNAGVRPTFDGVDVCPGPLGGVEWNGPAYDKPNHVVGIL